MKISLRMCIALGLAFGNSPAHAGPLKKALDPCVEKACKSVLESATLIASVDQSTLSTKLSAYGITAKNGVKVYRIRYHTQRPDGLNTLASGVVIVPEGTDQSHPWISLQHGTLPAKAEAPSMAPGEGLAEASQGFVVVVADYLGYGDSAEIYHPYIIEAGYTAPLLDMLRAAREFSHNNSLNLGKLFLKGYSEGGYATLALQKAIENQSPAEFQITASAPAAGPYDVDLTANIVTQKPHVNPANLPFLVLSYNKWLADDSLPLDSIFASPVDRVTTALSGAYTTQEIFGLLPTETFALFHQDFIEDFGSAAPTFESSIKLHQFLRNQSLIDGEWSPKAPTRFYHCRDDEQIPVESSEAAYAKFKSRGAPVEIVLISSPDPDHPYAHITCPAIFSSLQWFGEIMNNTNREGSAQKN